MLVNLELPHDADALLARPDWTEKSLPKGRKELIALAKENRAMLDLFWAPDETWAKEVDKWMSKERLLELGYKVAKDFIAVASAIMSRYGDKCLHQAFKPWPIPDMRAMSAGDLAEQDPEWVRLVSLVTSGVALVMAFGIQEGVQSIEAIPPSLSARVNQLIVTILSHAVSRSRSDDPGRNVELRKQVILVGLTRLTGSFEALSGRELLMLSGPFSHLRIREFPELAKRTEAVKQRYGERQIETIFEDQLALLAQSFGFYVVRARRATRRVDLLCLTAGHQDRYTALIEAKTSGRAYSFPTDDQRALREYIEDARVSLATLPALRFVLLVGSVAASTLERRLRDFESEVDIPVRFVAAETFVTLRDRLPGPVPTGAFRDVLVRSESRVLASNFVQEVASEFDKGHDAHVKFVQELMSSRH